MPQTPFAQTHCRNSRFQHWQRFWVIVMITAIALGLFHPWYADARQSSYALISQAEFNQPDYYPLKQSIDPNLYQPNGEWLGRLILPNVEEYESLSQTAAPTPVSNDWTWIELYQTPFEYQSLEGQVVRLAWQNSPDVRNDVNATTTDVQFNAIAHRTQQEGNVLPDRLNGRTQVGPLQSLAGARPNDDVIVRIEPRRVSKHVNLNQSILQITEAPVQVTGRYVGLVQILGPISSEVPKNALNPNQRASNQTSPQSSICSESTPCPSEYYQVRHYNLEKRGFKGPVETIRIPQQPLDQNNRLISTPNDISKSPAGIAGWYIYGAQDQQGIFTVQSLKPRALVQLQPDQVIRSQNASLRYIRQENWRNTPKRKGTIHKVLLDPDPPSFVSAQQDWQEGDQALVIHTFGGIGGKNREDTIFKTVTGHLSFGVAEVVKSPFTQELEFDIRYLQVYAHNPNAIVAGSIDWSAYSGDLQRGWMGSRPFSDAIIKLDGLSTLSMGNRQLSVLQTLTRQVELIAARYRTGDGSGVSAVSPATSCMQDSSQALYIAIQQLKQQVLSDDELMTWINQHPTHPSTLNFQNLVTLGNTLDNILIPYKVVRPDWKQNADVLAGIAKVDRFERDNRVLNALLSWRTILPRRGHDELAMIFLNHGAQIWFLRTNQSLGWDPTIEPLAPTMFLGQVPILSLLVRRITDAVSMPLALTDCLTPVLILVGYGAIALPLGWKTGFLRWLPEAGNKKQKLLGLAQLMFMPALIEEIVFRIALLPHPWEGFSMTTWLAWFGISLGLFVIYHPLNAITFYKVGNPTFFQPTFLFFAALLGIGCSLAYGFTGSLWPSVFIHWVIVSVWIWWLGGYRHLTN